MGKLEPNEMKIAKTVLWFIAGIIILVILLLINPFVMISAGERGIVLNWRAVSDEVLGEGIHFRIPIKQKIEQLDVKTQKEEVETTSASHDLQMVSTKIALNYHLDPENVNNLWQNIGKEYKTRVIDPAIQEAVKAGTAKYTAEELVTKRPEVKEAIKIELKERLEQNYIMVDDFSIVDFQFSQGFDKAIEGKVRAEQDALAAKNKLEQVKFEAEQKVTTAKAEAEAIKIQAEAITSQGGKDYVNLQSVAKWDGKLPQYMIPDGTLPFINLDYKE